MSDFGDRLREERARLKLNQAEFGELGGVSKNAQLSYEKGERSPDATYLMALQEKGVDSHFLLTGERTGRAPHLLVEGPTEMLLLLKLLNREQQDAVHVVLKGLAKGRD